MKKHLLTFTILSALVAVPAAAEENEFVTKDEFISRAGDKFDNSDVDGDGKLSKEERKSAIQDHHERRKERFEDRKETRQDRREDRREVHQDKREDHRELRQDRREDRRENRQDRRETRRDRP